jgi:hypothetical protein
MIRREGIKMNYSLRWLPIILLIVILTSCGSNPDFDRLLLSTCPAPCWFGVIPGKTTKSELAGLVNTFPFYRQNHAIWRNGQGTDVENAVPEDPNTSFIMMIGNNLAGVEVEIKDNIVTYVLIDSFVKNSDEYQDLGFTLEDMIQLYGQPSDMFLGSGCPNGLCQNIYLVNSQKGVLIVAESRDPSQEVQILPTLPIRSIVYFDPPNAKDPLLRVSSNNDCNFYPLRMPWQGYTTVEFSRSLWECGLNP